LKKDTPLVKTPIDVPPSRLWWLGRYGEVIRLEESRHAISAKQMLEGVAPEDTPYMEVIGDQPGCHGKPDKFYELIQSVKEGWVNKGKGVVGFINGNGQIIVHDGMHRASAALAVGLSGIPVSIHGRDGAWTRFRRLLADLNGGHKLYQHIDHPDLAYWPSWRRDTPARIEVLRDVLVDCLSVIDVGFHTGVISCQLARDGKTVRGVESNPLAVEVANALATMADIGTMDVFHNVPMIRFASEYPAGLMCEAVVCLSALNHAIVKGKGDEMLKWLAGMAKERLVLDHPSPGDPVGGDQPWSDTRTFVELVSSVIGWNLKMIIPAGEMQRTMCVWDRP
jgi:hypothetical protein